MEDGDPCDIVCRWAERERRDSNKLGVLFVEEKIPDKNIEVQLANMCPKCLERSTGVPGG